MSLRPGWLSLFIFVWIIGAFLGSTFEYQSSVNGQGISYSAGTADFTLGSNIVTGHGTTWVDATMAGGYIKCNNDGNWYKIKQVNNNTQLVIYGAYSQIGGNTKSYTMAASAGWAGTSSTQSGYQSLAPTTTLDYIFNISNAFQKNTILGNIPLPLPNQEYFKTVFKVITWQWSFMYNTDGTMALGMFYWIFCAPFVAMGVLSLIVLAYGLLVGNLRF